MCVCECVLGVSLQKTAVLQACGPAKETDVSVSGTLINSTACGTLHTVAACRGVSRRGSTELCTQDSRRGARQRRLGSRDANRTRARRLTCQGAQVRACVGGKRVKRPSVTCRLRLWRAAVRDWGLASRRGRESA
jgi:hypothetical protein